MSKNTDRALRTAVEVINDAIEGTDILRDTASIDAKQLVNNADEDFSTELGKRVIQLTKDVTLLEALIGIGAALLDIADTLAEIKQMIDLPDDQQPRRVSWKNSDGRASKGV